MLLAVIEAVSLVPNLSASLPTGKALEFVFNNVPHKLPVFVVNFIPLLGSLVTISRFVLGEAVPIPTLPSFLIITLVAGAGSEVLFPPPNWN